MTLSEARKAANKAPKFYLELKGLNLYLAATSGLVNFDLTPDKAKAMAYAQGFDNPQMKLAIWNTTAKRIMNNDEAEFEIAY